jgi:hypothetical protein
MIDSSELVFVIAGVAAIGTICASTISRRSTYATGGAQSTRCSESRVVSARAARTSRSNVRGNGAHIRSPSTGHDSGEASAAVQHLLDTSFNTSLGEGFHDQMKPVTFDPRLANKARTRTHPHMMLNPRLAKGLGHQILIPGIAGTNQQRARPKPRGDLFFNVPEVYLDAMKDPNGTGP